MITGTLFLRGLVSSSITVSHKSRLDISSSALMTFQTWTVSHSRGQAGISGPSLGCARSDQRRRGNPGQSCRRRAFAAWREPLGIVQHLLYAHLPYFTPRQPLIVVPWNMSKNLIVGSRLWLKAGRQCSVDRSTGGLCVLAFRKHGFVAKDSAASSTIN